MHTLALFRLPLKLANEGGCLIYFSLANCCLFAQKRTPEANSDAREEQTHTHTQTVCLTERFALLFCTFSLNENDAGLVLPEQDE